VAEWEYSFDPDKNAWLIRERRISFEQMIALIEAGKLLRVMEHPNKGKDPGQLLYEVDVEGYVHVVPVIQAGNTLFLKTVYPSRKATRESKKGGVLMKKRDFSDEEERKVISAYERGEFRPVKDQKTAKETAVHAARRYMRKDARINIRLSSADLEMLKRHAAEEGLAYQTLIASILHKYASGSASRRI
jgi:predicted DNA binding CopG/RHH family protein